VMRSPLCSFYIKKVGFAVEYAGSRRQCVVVGE
jgi:hypothetical protein